MSNVHLVCLINAMMYNPFNWNVQLTWNVTIIFCIVPNLKTTAINGNELQTEHNRGSKWWVIKKLIIQYLFWVVSISVHIIIDRDTIRWRNMQLLFFFCLLSSSQDYHCKGYIPLLLNFYPFCLEGPSVFQFLQIYLTIILVWDKILVSYDSANFCQTFLVKF